MFVSDSEDHILEKILKTVEGSAGIEERTLFLKKIEQGDLHISLSGKKVYRNGKEILLNRHEFDMGLKKDLRRMEFIKQPNELLKNRKSNRRIHRIRFKRKKPHDHEEN